MPIYIDKNDLLNGIYSENPKDIMQYIAVFPTADVPERNLARWIPCSERLPEHGQKVLCCDDGRIYIDERGLLGWRFRVTDYDAWMPLPEPWKGEEDD